MSAHPKQAKEDATKGGRKLASTSEVTAKALKPKVASYQVGMLAGMNLGYGATNPSSTGGTRTGLSLSVFLEKGIFDHGFIAPEIRYIQRGAQTSLASIAGVDVTGMVSLDYIEFLLPLKYKIPLGPKRLAFFLSLAPTFAIAINRSVEVLGLVNVDLISRFSNTDVTLNAGGGLEYVMGPEWSGIFQVRNAFGLKNIDSQNEFHTRGIEILLGFLFRL